MKSPDYSRHGDGKDGGGSNIDIWLHKAQSGEEQAKCDLCAFVWKVAYRKALTMKLPSVYNQQDFAQDVVIKLLGQLPHIRNLKNWLLRVFIGAQANAFRKYHEKHVTAYETYFEKTDGDFENSELARFEVSRLLEGLDTFERDIVFLRYIDSHSFAEIAEILQSTEGAVRTQFWRTKTKLQKLLGSNFGEGHPHGSQSPRA